jgi:hypothetical protein
MSATRWHKLTALLLTLLYGVVGLTGEVLHDLVTDPGWLWAVSQPAESAGYYHWHGPDYHGHFHRHAPGSDHRHDVAHHRHVAQNGGGTSGEEDATAFVAWQERIHRPHACPVLTLVSTLALGHGGGCSAALILDVLVTPSREDGMVHPFEVALSFQARGPPCGLLV